MRLRLPWWALDSCSQLQILYSKCLNWSRVLICTQMGGGGESDWWRTKFGWERAASLSTCSISTGHNCRSTDQEIQMSLNFEGHMCWTRPCAKVPWNWYCFFATPNTHRRQFSDRQQVQRISVQMSIQAPNPNPIHPILLIGLDVQNHSLVIWNGPSQTRADQGRARYSWVLLSTARYSQVPKSVKQSGKWMKWVTVDKMDESTYSLVQNHPKLFKDSQEHLGTARKSQVQPLWYLRCYCAFKRNFAK